MGKAMSGKLSNTWTGLVISPVATRMQGIEITFSVAQAADFLLLFLDSISIIVLYDLHHVKIYLRTYMYTNLNKICLSLG